MKMDQTYKWGGPDDVYEVTRVRGGVDAPAAYLCFFFADCARVTGRHG